MLMMKTARMFPPRLRGVRKYPITATTSAESPCRPDASRMPITATVTAAPLMTRDRVVAKRLVSWVDSLLPGCTPEGRRADTTASDYVYRSPASAASFSMEWVACSVRTVPERERITSDCVRAPPAR